MTYCLRTPMAGGKVIPNVKPILHSDISLSLSLQDEALRRLEFSQPTLLRKLRISRGKPLLPRVLRQPSRATLLSRSFHFLLQSVQLHLLLGLLLLLLPQLRKLKAAGDIVSRECESSRLHQWHITRGLRFLRRRKMPADRIVQENIFFLFSSFSSSSLLFLTLILFYSLSTDTCSASFGRFLGFLSSSSSSLSAPLLFFSQLLYSVIRFVLPFYSFAYAFFHHPCLLFFSSIFCYKPRTSSVDEKLQLCLRSQSS